MRIAYLLGEWLDPTTGPTRKVKGQVRAWREAGHQVDVLSFEARQRGAMAISATSRVVRRAMELAPDVVYIRQQTFTPAHRALLRSIPCVVEINSDDLAELSTRRLPYRLYHRATRGLLFRGVTGVVSPTRELARRPSITRFRRPVAVIANGIDLGTTPEHPAPRNRRPRLLFTYSSTGPWPGVDLLIRAAGQLPEFDFDIVGPPPPISASSNVHIHGVLAGSDYQALVGQADVGVGSLGMHRIGLTEGSTLKVRGYLAAGVPTILGYEDTDFPDGAPFLLQLPAAEDAIEVSLNSIRGFVREQVGRRVPRAAIAHIDSKAKERARLSLLIAAASGNPW